MTRGHSRAETVLECEQLVCRRVEKDEAARAARCGYGEQHIEAEAGLVEQKRVHWAQLVRVRICVGHRCE